jgi:hypothetical protein
MTFIDETWLRRAHKALTAVFDVDDRTRNDMIQFLFDEGFWDPEKLTHEAALTRWRANCNPGKGEFWKIGEVWTLSVRFNRPQLMQAWAESMGYEVRAIPTAERQQVLLERMCNAMEQAEAARAETLAELQRLHAPPPREHLPSTPGTRPQFSMREPTAVERIGPL